MASSLSRKLPSFSFIRSMDKDNDSGSSDSDDDIQIVDNGSKRRKSRSLFRTFGSSGSASVETKQQSGRTPSPYAGRQSYRTSKQGKPQTDGETVESNMRRKDYANAPSSTNVSEAESDGDAVSQVRQGSQSATATPEASLSRSTSALSLGQDARPSASTSAVPATPATAQSAQTTPPQITTSRPTDGSPASGSRIRSSKLLPRNAYYESRDVNDAAPPHTTKPKGILKPSSSSTSLASQPQSPPVGPSTGSSSTSGKKDVWLDASVRSESESEATASEGNDSDDYDDEDYMDPTLLANTEANAGPMSASELLNSKSRLWNASASGQGFAGEDGDEDLEDFGHDAYYYDETGAQEDWPNLVRSPASPFVSASTSTSARSSRQVSASYTNSPTLSPESTTSSTFTGPGSAPAITRSDKTRSGTIRAEIPLVASRPVYERNRCTITLTHGEPDSYVIPSDVDAEAAADTGGAKGITLSASQVPRKKRRRKTYVVASDLSEESYYAIEWAIGTVLRSGDQLLFITVMETDSKLDPEPGAAQDKSAKIRAQQERQTRALQLSREATALLERTRLHVRVKCQAIHAKNARHMLVDLIEYFQPTLVIIGSRGLSRLKGIVLGSVSHYLIQKSSAPVMVTRRRLKALRKPPRPISDLQRQPRVTGLANATIDIESHAGVVKQSDDEPSSRVGPDADGGRSDAETAGETDLDVENKSSVP